MRWLVAGKRESELAKRQLRVTKLIYWMLAHSLILLCLGARWPLFAGAPARLASVPTKKKPKKAAQEEPAHYVVHEILDAKIENNKQLFKTWWEGYPEDEATWEPVEVFDTSALKKMVSDFLSKPVDSKVPAAAPSAIPIEVVEAVGVLNRGTGAPFSVHGARNLSAARNARTKW